MLARAGWRRRALRHAIGFGLQARVLHHRHTAAERVAHPARPLLHHVGELVPDEPLPVRALRSVGPGREIDVRPHREGHCSDRGRLRTFVDADVGEGRSEEGLHLLLDRGGERLPRPRLGEVDRSWHLERTPLPQRRPRQPLKHRLVLLERSLHVGRGLTLGSTSLGRV